MQDKDLGGETGLQVGGWWLGPSWEWMGSIRELLIRRKERRGLNIEPQETGRTKA